jgi:hypothetical protein
VLAGFGWSLSEPNVDVMYRSPVDIYIDESQGIVLDKLLPAAEDSPQDDSGLASVSSP